MNHQGNYRDSVNPNSVAQGNEFEEFVKTKLFWKGICIGITRKASDQFRYGDSKEGVEIKRDNIFPSSHRLSIEVCERTNVNRAWVLSGILKDDNCWAYVQGNLSTFWVFSKGELKRIFWATIRESFGPLDETATVRKFYITVENADEICILKYPRDWPEHALK